MIKKLSLPFIGLLLTISAYCQERPFTAGVSVGYIQNCYDAKNQKLSYEPLICQCPAYYKCSISLDCFIFNYSINKTIMKSLQG